MGYLSDQCLKQFIKDINEDSTVPAAFKEKIDEMYLKKKIAIGSNLKNLLNTFNLDTPKVNNEITKD